MFHTSSFSAATNCVLVNLNSDELGMVAVRDSKDTAETPTTLRFTTKEWAAFINGAKNGEFDVPVDTSANNADAVADQETVAV